MRYQRQARIVRRPCALCERHARMALAPSAALVLRPSSIDHARVDPGLSRGSWPRAPPSAACSVLHRLQHRPCRVAPRVPVAPAPPLARAVEAPDGTAALPRTPVSRITFGLRRWVPREVDDLAPADIGIRLIGLTSSQQRLLEGTSSPPGRSSHRDAEERLLRCSGQAFGPSEQRLLRGRRCVSMNSPATRRRPAARASTG